jgi:hypothetical protein
MKNIEKLRHKRPGSMQLELESRCGFHRSFLLKAGDGVKLPFDTLKESGIEEPIKFD